jgi:hypothetical protein
LYLDSLHTLNILLKRNIFYSETIRREQEFLEVYKTYIVPFHRYYDRVFVSSYSDDPDQFNNEYDSFSDLQFLNYRSSIDSFSLFSEYIFDEEEEDQWTLMNDEIYPGTDEDDFELEDDEDDEFEFFDEDFDDEEESDDFEDDGIDFLIPAESFNYNNFFFDKQTNNSPLFDKTLPIEISSVFKSEQFDDNLLVKDLGWVSELVVDRFLIDVSPQNDYSFEGDFLLLSKISQYSEMELTLDYNILNAKSNRFREFILEFLNSLSCNRIGIMTIKLKRNVGMFSSSSVNVNRFADTPVSFVKDTGSNLGESPLYEFDFNSQFFETFANKRAFFVFYHPYKNTTSFFSKIGLNLVPLLGHEAYDNKYKRKFFKDPLFYIQLLNLKNYPDLTIEEAQRLWLFLGCTKEEWDSVDNNLNTSKKISPVFDSIEFPFLISLFIFCFSLRTWVRYSIIDIRYYKYSAVGLLDRIFNLWLLDPAQFLRNLDYIYIRQTFNEYYFSSYNYITFYRSVKVFIVYMYDFFVIFFSFLFYFFFQIKDPSVFSLENFLQYITPVLDHLDPGFVNYVLTFISYFVLSYQVKWQPLFYSLSVFCSLFVAKFYLLFSVFSYYFISYCYSYLNLDFVFSSFEFVWVNVFDYFSIDSFLNWCFGYVFSFDHKIVYFYYFAPFLFFSFLIVLKFLNLFYLIKFVFFNITISFFISLLVSIFISNIFFEFIYILILKLFPYNFLIVDLFSFLILFIFFCILFFIKNRRKPPK